MIKTVGISALDNRMLGRWAPFGDAVGPAGAPCAVAATSDC
jgi:hypothetical protein